jgi:hypothetical protein
MLLLSNQTRSQTKGTPYYILCHRLSRDKFAEFKFSSILHLLLQSSSNLIRFRYCDFSLVNFSQSLNIITIYYCPAILLKLTFKQCICSVNCSKLLVVNKAKLQISISIVSALTFVTKCPLTNPNQNLEIIYLHNSQRSRQDNFPNQDPHGKRTRGTPPSRFERVLEPDCNSDWGNRKGLNIRRNPLGYRRHPQ